jgi:hypothetical protein
MSPILTAHCAIEFQYGEAAKYSSFEVVFAEFGTRKRIAKKLPLSTSSSDMWALVSSEMACKKSPTVVTQEQLLWHCSVYERNIYYLRTLLHDSKLHSFVVWLLEWYVQSFVVSLSVLITWEPAVAHALPEPVPEVLRSALQARGICCVATQNAG